MIHMAVGIDVTVIKRKEYLSAIIALNVVVWIKLVGTAEKDKLRETRMDWLGGQEGQKGQETIRDTEKPYYCSKKCVNNVQEAIKDTDKLCCCCKKYVAKVNKFNKCKQYISRLCRTINYCSKDCQEKQTTKIYISL